MKKQFALILVLPLLLAGCSTVNVEQTNELGVQTVKIDSQIITLNSTPNITELISLNNDSTVEGYNKVDNEFISKDYRIGFTNAYIGSSIGDGDLAVTKSFMDSMSEVDAVPQDLGITKIKTSGGGTVEFMVTKFKDRILIARGVDIVFDKDSGKPSEKGFVPVTVITILPNEGVKQFEDLASVEKILSNVTIEVK